MSYQYILSEEDRICLIQLTFEFTGIALRGHKQAFLYNRLIKRLKELNLPNFQAYCQLLKTDNLEERRLFINAITTTVTSFFRENYHFEYLKNNFLPELCAKQESAKSLRIWSAGCSSGEEPYSIAMTISEAIPLSLRQNWDIKILATDLNREALNVAKAGIYPSDSIASVTPSRKKRWFLKGTGKNLGYVLIKPELQHLISFKELNLNDEWPLTHPFDIIFCRNVVIYFNKETQRILFDKFAALLKPHGILILGHSESLYRVSKRFGLIGHNIYKKLP